VRKLSPQVVFAVLELQRALVERQRAHAVFRAELEARSVPKVTAASASIPPAAREAGEELTKARLALDILLLGDV
jgi:hypothetical protein